MEISLEKIKALKVDDLKKYFESLNFKNLFSDKTFVAKLGIGAFLFFINFLIYSIWLSPKLSQQTQKIELMKDYKIKTAQYNANFNNLQNEINSLKNTPTSIGLFYSKKESEELYQSLSIYATNNGLSITSLNKGNPQKVGPGGAQKVGKDGKPAAVQASYYYKIPVTFQVKGSYIGYLKFRAALSRSSKFVNFDKENIVVNQGDRTNTITADVAITIVGLPDEFN